MHVPSRRPLAVGLLLLLAACPALAEGTFISAPQRVDIAYDDARQVLYISTTGASVLRYDMADAQFLDPIFLPGVAQGGGLDISPDGTTLVAADRSTARVAFHLIDLATLELETVTFEPAFSEAGTFAAAYAADGAILFTTLYQGSGWTPLRRHDPATGETTVIEQVRGRSMVKASADRKVIAIAQDDCTVGRYRVSDGTLKTACTGGAAYEVGVSRNARQYVFPAYFGGKVADGDLAFTSDQLGVYAGPQPIGAVHDPVRDLFYVPWAQTTEVKVYDVATVTEVGSFDFESVWGVSGQMALATARVKVSNDGSLLFSTVSNGVRYVSLARVAPSGLHAFGSSGSATLKWLPSPGATEYAVHGGTDADNLAVLASGLTEPTAVLAGLTDGVAHYFRVVAQTAAGDSAPSATVHVTPGSVPAAPTGLTASGEARGASLQWTAVATATAYDVYVATSPGGQVTPVKTGIAGTSVDIEDLEVGTTHYFKVAAKNAHGAGVLSDEASAVPTAPQANQGGGGGGGGDGAAGGGGGGGALSLALTIVLAGALLNRRRTQRRSTPAA